MSARTLASSPLRRGSGPGNLDIDGVRADVRGVTAFSLTGPLPAVLDDVPDGWQEQSFDATWDDDALSWLGFEPTGEPDVPLLRWSQPARWPARAGRHRAPSRLRRSEP